MADAPLELTFPVLVRYLARLDGRDKMLRLLQYGSRLCMWSAEASSSLGAKDPGAQWYKKSYKGISLHRKAFRLFKWAQEYHAACEFMDDAKLSPVKRRLNVLNKAALAAYLVNDNINWAIGLKLTQAAPDRFKAWAYRARCTAAVCQAVLIWMKWRALRRERAALTGGALRSEEQRAEDRAALAALKRKEWELTLKTAKVLGDVVVYASATAKVTPLLPGLLVQNDGVVGAAGVLATIAAQVLILRKVQPKK